MVGATLRQAQGAPLKIDIGATGFEPATPCAQGKLVRPLKVLILERFAASENSWAQIWALPTRRRVVTLREERQSLAVRAPLHIVGQ